MSTVKKQGRVVPKKKPALKAKDEEGHVPSERSEEIRAATAQAVVDSGKLLELGKVFNVEHTKRDELRFTLKGTTLGGDPFQETFRCLPQLPGETMSDMIFAAEAPTMIYQHHLVRMIRQAVLPEEESRYDAILSSKEHLITLDQLASVGAFLVEEYTGRPIGPSTD